MSKWNDFSFKIENDDDVYRDFLNRTGAQKITHYALTMFGDPALESFLKNIEVEQHMYSLGDTLSKIAYRYYGDPSAWWVLAWFNGKPTDFHCSIGDTINVPTPLEEVIPHAQNIGEL